MNPNFKSTVYVIISPSTFLFCSKYICLNLGFVYYLSNHLSVHLSCSIRLLFSNAAALPDLRIVLKVMYSGTNVTALTKHLLGRPNEA